MDFVLKSFKIDLKITKLANIHYFEFTPNYHTSNDSHEFCELVYVDKGNINISSDHYTGRLSQGQMIVHGANQNHSLDCDEQEAPNIIIIGFECYTAELDELTHSPLTLTDELKKMLSEIIKEARAVYLPPYNVPNLKNMKKQKNFTFGADQLIKNYLQIFLIKCLRLLHSAPSAVSLPQPLAESSQIYEVKRYLDENFCQKIHLEELCFLFNTNKTSLSVGFKHAFQKTIVEYLNDLRIARTKLLLREGNHTLTQIADLMQMSSVHYLTALFKKITHMTPTEYVRSLKETLS
ncbi:MAG: helix-turn-helix domain-containing protein [Clostridiales bacterium]|nr:helix-turn-helix domain-containing protein [Clostridiales bacterium]MBQ2769380.1 helix-turn-helix domain-containing protein [Clostridia bacterium]